MLVSYYIPSKRFPLKLKGIFDARVISINKKEYGFAVYFLEKFIKPLKSISDEWLRFVEALIFMEFS